MAHSFKAIVLGLLLPGCLSGEKVDTATDTTPVTAPACDQPTTWYADADGDGFGDLDSTTALVCDQPSGYVSNITDCDDTDATVNPDATEYCDGVDNNCDGVTDEDSAVDDGIWYVDKDSDGYGDKNSAGVRSCTEVVYDWRGESVDSVENDDDCDDRNIAVNPRAAEICDGLDNDCDGLVDDEDVCGT